MALPPVVCDKDCHTKRFHLYLFYTTFLASLVLLALLHFIFFLSSRRKTKYEAREYATRKLEFVSGMPEILPSTEKDNVGGKTSHSIEEDENHHESNHETSYDSMSPEPSTSAASLSALNRILAVNGIGSVPLQRIDEESIGLSRDAMSSSNRGSLSSSCSTTTPQDRTVIGALQEPVIVTVATVSALFQQHEGSEPMEQRSRSHSSESMSSVLDISDLVNSPGRSITVRAEDSGNEEPKGSLGDWGVGVERGLHTKHQMLDVRIGDGRGGYLKSHRGEQLRKGESF